MTHNETLIQQVRATVFAELDRLQFREAERFLLMRSLPIGLGGQVSMRLETLRLALMLDRRAVFPSLADKPYTAVFAAMNVPTDMPTDVLLPEVDPHHEQSDRFLSFDRMINGPEHFDSVVHRGIIARLALPPLSNLVLDGLILQWMKLLPDMEEFVSANKVRLGISTTTLGVHFRRGDKSVETAYVPESEFNARIQAMHERWPFTELFLASDDPSAPSRIALPPGVSLIFDNTEERFNNANHKMLMRNPELAEQETRVAYKNIYLLAHCGGIIGIDNAHFSTLAARAVLARGGDDRKIILIDGQFAEKKSALLKIVFDIKRLMRAAARIAFRRFTIRERMNRSDRGRPAK